MNPRDLLFAISMLLLLIGMVRPSAVAAGERASGSCSEIEVRPKGESAVPANRASGLLSQGESSRDGCVAASRGGAGVAPWPAPAQTPR